MGVFITQGLLIGWLGAALGVALGVAARAATSMSSCPSSSSTFGLHIMDDPDVYYITGMPSEMHAADVLGIAAAALLLTLLATIYPALRAAQDPARRGLALRMMALLVRRFSGTALSARFAAARLRLVHRRHLGLRARARRRRAHRGAVGDERLRAGAAHPHPERHRACHHLRSRGPHLGLAPRSEKVARRFPACRPRRPTSRSRPCWLTAATSAGALMRGVLPAGGAPRRGPRAASDAGQPR